MALKALMVKKTLTDRQNALDSLVRSDDEFVKREAEIEASINEVTSEEERSAVDEAISAFETEKTEHEDKKANLRAEIEKLEKELAEIEEAQDTTEPVEERKENKEMEVRDYSATEMQERAAFVDYIRSGKMTRDDYNMTKGNNGAIVPKTIAQEVIARVREISPLFEKATRYTVKGQLDVPYYPASSSHVIAAAYGTEFQDLVASSGDFGSVSLTGYLAGALAKISKSLINNTEVDVVPFIVEEMAKAFAAFIEGEAINGTNNKIAGLAGGVTLDVTAAKMSTIKADELIELQDKIPDAFQANACWIMSRATRTLVRKLKDGQGNYLLVKNFANDGPAWELLGKPVYVSENMPEVGTAANKTVYYGDFSGLSMKFAEDVDIEVLREKFATQHAVGVVGWTELDCKVTDAQKIAVLKMGAAD